jgi:serine protease Do
MRDSRLLVVLGMSLGLIVVGGVLVPMAMTGFAPAAVSSMSASAAAEKVEPLPPIPPEIDKMSEGLRIIAKHLKPAVVAVGVSQTVTDNGPLTPDEFLRRFFGDEPGGSAQPAPRRKLERRGLGSGVIVDPEGFILTNAHVVADADSIKVRLADGREFDAKVVGSDPASDIAVIRIKADHLPYAQLGDSDKADAGDLVLAIGSPFGLELTVTMGIISATGRAGVGITDFEDFLQTDAAINPGNSGGPLVNMKGQVIGINSAIATRSGGSAGVGFAVPSNLAAEVMKRLRDKGVVTRGWIGVSIAPLTRDKADALKLKSADGVLVRSVFDGGPAAKGGLKADDVVLEINGKAVKVPYDLQSAVAWAEPGSEITVVVSRGGKTVPLKVGVQKRPDNPALAAAQGTGGGESGGAAAAVELKDIGIEVSPVTADATSRYGYKPGQGALVTDADPAGLGARAGLKAGMLIFEAAGQKVTSPADLKAVLAKADLAKGLPMLVRQGDRQVFFVIRKR